MQKTILLLALAATATSALPVAAAEPAIIDDWRKVGPPDGDDPPHAKGQLSPAAAQRLVAAIDQAWKDGRPLRARGDEAEWLVDNLRFFHLGADGGGGPRTAGPADARACDGESPRRVELLGTRGAGDRSLLLIRAAVAFDESGGCCTDATFGLVVAADGAVRDVGVLARGWGDGGFASVRKVRLQGEVLRLSDVLYAPGDLCVVAGEEDPTCDVAEGESYDLRVGGDGRFLEKGRRPLNLTGHFIDRTTGEVIRIEEGQKEGLRLGYRAREGASWKALKIATVDRGRRTVTAKFTKSPVTYTLTLAADGRSLVSAGSDGSKPQRFVWVPPAER